MRGVVSVVGGELVGQLHGRLLRGLAVALRLDEVGRDVGGMVAVVGLRVVNGLFRRLFLACVLSLQRGCFIGLVDETVIVLMGRGVRRIFVLFVYRNIIPCCDIRKQ